MGDGPSTTKTESSSTTPWAPQQSYLIGAFKDAQNAYDQNMAQGAYKGDYVAAPSTQQYDAYGNAVTQGYNQQNTNNGMLTQGAANMNTGSAGATTAINNLTGFAANDPTQGNIDKANQYVAGLDIPGAVQAGMLSANQNASENDIPNIYRGAAASGGVNSDRAALAQGVVERGLAQQAAGLSATLHNSAYTTGLSNAQQGNAQTLQADAQLGSLGGGLLTAGNAAQNSGIANQASINSQTTGGANGATSLDQSTLQNLMDKYNGGQQFSTTQLQNLMAIIGKPLGSQTTGTSTATTTPSLMQDIGSGVGIASALFCDRNIKFVYGITGRTWRGFPEYLFSYRADTTGTLHAGPMAQDVELTAPHAVTTIGGIKVILTDKL